MIGNFKISEWKREVKTKPLLYNIVIKVFAGKNTHRAVLHVRSSSKDYNNMQVGNYTSSLTLIIVIKRRFYVFQVNKPCTTVRRLPAAVFLSRRLLHALDRARLPGEISIYYYLLLLLLLLLLL